MMLTSRIRRLAPWGGLGLLAAITMASGSFPRTTKSAAWAADAPSAPANLKAAGAADLGLPDGSPATANPTCMDPSRVMGAQACIQCHKPIVAAWQTTQHATGFDKLHLNPNAKTYAGKLGISMANLNNAVCANCHGMHAEGTENKTVTGVSCESCHGPAGGEKGWLNAHGSYGAKGLTRDQETDKHREMRFELCDQAGMVRPERTYLLAKNCFACHLMQDHETVVNKSGHHAGSSDFELVSWIHGEVDHNLFIDPKTNALAPSLWMARTKKTAKERDRVLYIVGKLAGLEIALRNVAASTSEDSFSHAMAGHARDYGLDISDIADATKLPEMSDIADGMNRLRRKLQPANKQALTKFADTVAQTAIEFVKSHDGSKLSGADSLLPTDQKGSRYQPK
jgi:hypothetical protein